MIPLVIVCLGLKQLFEAQNPHASWAFAVCPDASSHTEESWKKVKDIIKEQLPKINSGQLIALCRKHSCTCHWADCVDWKGN